MLVARLLDPRPGDTVVDACAALAILTKQTLLAAPAAGFIWLLASWGLLGLN